MSGGLVEYGYVTAEDAQTHGVDPAQLRLWHRRGVVQRLGQGVYRFPQGPTTPLDPFKLATLWPAGRGVLSHDTALDLHELCDINPPNIHITVPGTYRPRRAGGDAYVVHHKELDERDVTWHDGIRIVTPSLAIRQGIESGVPRHLIRQALDNAGHRGLTSPDTRADLELLLEED